MQLSYQCTIQIEVPGEIKQTILFRWGTLSIAIYVYEEILYYWGFFLNLSINKNEEIYYLIK